MNIFHVPATLVERLGWVLVHSAWEFALMALVATAIQRAMARCSAAARYWTLLVTLAGMVVAPAVTWLSLPTDTPFAGVAAVSDQRVPEPSESAEPLLNPDPATSSKSDLLVADSTPLAEQTGASFGPIQGGFVRDRWWASVEATVKPRLRSIVAIWCLGVVTFGLRPLLSWYTMRRLRSVGVSAVPAAVAAMLQQTAERLRLRLRQTVQILQSTLTRVPVVIGYLRPVILLPVSVIAGVPTSQLEAILAHELAHVRRHDFLVNLLQTLVETVFFYHPAVWWLSHRIRVERENCCDDLAVAAIGNRVEYGRALLALVELRGTTTTLALGVRSGSLLDRVRRLFGRDPAERSVGAGSVVGVGLLALVIIAVGVWNSTHADDDGTTPGATAKVTRLEPPTDASLDVVAQIADAAYARPTADDQRATATIPAEAWGEPVDGLRVAIVLRSPPVDKDESLRYDIVAENVSDHDIRFSATLGVDDWHNYCKTKLVDADGKQVAQQEGTHHWLRTRLIRIWLKPKDRGVISPWASGLFKQDEAGKPLASPEGYRGLWYFSVKPGRYSVSAAMELGPSTYSTDPASGKRTVLSPAKGEWSGKLQTGAVAVALFTQPAPADEGAAKHPPIEFRIAASKADRDADGVAWFPIIEPRRPAPAEQSGANVPIEEKLDDKWRGLLWNKAEHALLADGTWRVVKCDVARSEHSTELVPSFEIQITLDAAGGALMRRLTAAHLNQSLAIVVTGTIVAAPVLRSEIGETWVISGDFSKATAEKLAAAIRKHDPRIKLASDESARAIFVLRFAEAKSALAAMKDEADSRKIRGFEATIDPRLNTITISADADTLKALQEILGRLDSDEWPPRDPVKLLERLRLRDAEFDRRSLQSERHWVTRVEPRTRITDDQKTGSRQLPGSRMFGRSQLSNVDKRYDQPHRVPYLLTVHGQGDGLVSDVVIDNADDLETMTDSRFEPAVKSERWPERPQQLAYNEAMMESLILETQQLASTRQAFEWSTGYGFAKRIVSVDELRVKNDRVVISGKSRVFELGKSYPQGSPPPPHHDSQYQMELDSDFIVRKAEFSLTYSPEVHQRVIPNYDRIQSILIETSGIVRPTNAPPVAAEGHYRLVVQKPDKSQHTYHNDRFTFVALSARLTDDELSQRTAPTREFYSVTQPAGEASSKNATSTVLAPAEIGPEHDGKEVTMIFKITDTQLIGGEREGEYPHMILHYVGMKKPPYLAVYAKGELADALHRFASVAPDDRFVGRSIKASGKIRMHKDFPKGEDQTPIFYLDLRDWKKFQILPEPKGE